LPRKASEAIGDTHALEPHIGRHFTGTETVRDIVIGMSDGLTVPFAPRRACLTQLITTRIIVTAGLAEIAAGLIAMGLKWLAKI
jgi:vacuolar iron transporter family protein